MSEQLLLLGTSGKFDRCMRQSSIFLYLSRIKEIIVSDNGTGMDATDARLALEPHATSKIAKPNDLLISQH